MRIVSYNVRYFGHGLKGLASTAAGKARIARALLQLEPSPEIVCLQEIEDRSLRSALAYRGSKQEERQIDAFMRHLGEQAAQLGVKQRWEAWYFPAHRYGVGALSLYTTGLAVLVDTSKLKVIANNREQPHRVTHIASKALQGLKQTRICAHLQLEESSGSRFHVFNTHLSLPSPWQREFWQQKVRMGYGPNQLKEAQTLVDYVRDRSAGEPLLVCGDFNSAPGTPVYRYLTQEAQFTGAQQVLTQIDPEAPGSFSTAGFMRMRMHLDHLFGAKVLFTDLNDTCRFGDSSSRFHGLSDHVPLIAGFSLG